MTESPVTLFFIAVNVIVSLAAFQAGSGASRRHFVFTPYRVARGQDVLGMLGSQFSHADGSHLVLNLLGLYFFGPVLESGLSGVSLAIVYVGAGVLSTALTFALRYRDPSFRALGSSGAVAGVLFAAIVLRPSMDLYLLFVPIPIPAPIFAVVYVVASSYFMGRVGSRICHEAHVGGALGGAALGGALSPEGFAPLLERVRELVAA